MVSKRRKLESRKSKPEAHLGKIRDQDNALRRRERTDRLADLEHQLLEQRRLVRVVKLEVRLQRHVRVFATQSSLHLRYCEALLLALADSFALRRLPLCFFHVSIDSQAPERVVVGAKSAKAQLKS